METLIDDFSSGAFTAPTPPCLSLYQPTHRHHPDNRQDPIRFRNLVKRLAESLERRYEKRDVAALLSAFHALAEDEAFWNHSRDALAVLAAGDLFRVYRLQRPVREFAIAADSFHVKPLLRILQSADRYQVLGVSRREFALFEGNRDVLDAEDLPPEVASAINEALPEGAAGTRPEAWTHESGRPGVFHGRTSHDSKLDSDTERVFRAADRAVLEYCSQPSRLPLVLAALPEHHAVFRRVSRNPYLLPEAIDVFPAVLPIEELRERVWHLLAPHYHTRLAGLVEMFGASRARELGSDDLQEMAVSAVAGRIGTLLIEADRHVPGRIEPGSGAVQHSDLDDPETDDLLDDLAQLVLANRGQVVVVPTDRMPSRSGAAAIYRY